MIITREDMERLGHKDDWDVYCLYRNAAQELVDEKLATLQASHKELVKALESLRQWMKAESEGFDANMPDDFIWLKGTKALANAAKFAPTKGTRKPH